MSDADLSAPRPVRFGALIAVALLHLAVILALIHAFAPSFTSSVSRAVVSTFTVTVTPPSPEPKPEPKPSAGLPAGASGAAGKRATPREVAAPPPRIVLARPPAPQATSTGTADTSGARGGGAGTGAGGPGNGTGSGGIGDGTGNGGGSKPFKISGEINSASDFPKESRNLRIGDYVVIWISVGTDGRPEGCKVARPSRDERANAITCELATKRFRFRPATNANGQPIVSTYGWQQRWFYPNQPR